MPSRTGQLSAPGPLPPPEPLLLRPGFSPRPAVPRRLRGQGGGFPRAAIRPSHGRATAPSAATRGRSANAAGVGRAPSGVFAPRVSAAGSWAPAAERRAQTAEETHRCSWLRSCNLGRSSSHLCAGSEGMVNNLGYVCEKQDGPAVGRQGGGLRFLEWEASDRHWRGRARGAVQRV